jgi:chemotaxis protein methyltransferase CheR
MPTNLEDIEIELFLKAVKLRYGYDYQDYSHASLKRRLRLLKNKSQVDFISDMIHKVLHEDDFLTEVIDNLSVNVTEMFRDPDFFRDLRTHVLPALKSYPWLNIWIAGCSTGEEVFSLAILLHEEGLLKRSTIYATDINPKNLEIAKSGIFSLDHIPIYTRNYQKMGGERSFSDYYHAKYSRAKLSQFILEHIVFSEHNLAADNVFGEMQLILCRNVMIYFNKTLQNRSISLFYQSLVRSGFLCLGTKESLRAFDKKEQFTIVSKENKIYHKLLSTVEQTKRILL